MHVQMVETSAHQSEILLGEMALDKISRDAGPTAAVQRDLTKSSPTKSSKSMLLAELSTLTEQMTAQQLARLLADAKMIVK